MVYTPYSNHFFGFSTSFPWSPHACKIKNVNINKSYTYFSVNLYFISLIHRSLDSPAYRTYPLQNFFKDELPVYIYQCISQIQKGVVKWVGHDKSSPTFLSVSIFPYLFQLISNIYHNLMWPPMIPGFSLTTDKSLKLLLTIELCPQINF